MRIILDSSHDVDDGVYCTAFGCLFLFFFVSEALLTQGPSLFGLMIYMECNVCGNVCLIDKNKVF